MTTPDPGSPAPFDIAETDRLLSTTRSVRRRLDLDRPVELEVLTRCVELAQQAPTASNQQGWRWVFVTDPDLRRVIAQAYRAGGGGYLARLGQDRSRDQQGRVHTSAAYLGEILDRVPVLAIPCHEGHAPTSPVGQASYWGSIVPAIWSFMLALRSRGLGSAYTTMHLPYADQVGAALGIPRGWTQAALLPVAYTIGTDFKPAARPPAEEIISVNRW